MKRYKSKHRRGLTLGSLTWVGNDKEYLLGMVKTLIDARAEDSRNTEPTPNKKEDSNQ